MSDTHDITARYEVSDESLAEVMARIVAGISAYFGPCVVEDDYGDGLRIRTSEEPAWAVGASIEIRSRRVDPGGKLRRVAVEVNCGSTRRTPVQAAAFADHFRRFASAACLAEAIHEGHLYRHDPEAETP